MMVNNQFPGPMIEANWGGMCSINIYTNDMQLTFDRLD